MKFKIDHKVMGVGDDGKLVTVDKRYVCNNWDDMQNLVATIIEASYAASETFTITKEENNEEDR